MKLFKLLIFIGFVLSLHCVNAEAIQNKNVVLLYPENAQSLCSAFFIKSKTNTEDLYLVTAKHCLVEFAGNKFITILQSPVRTEVLGRIFYGAQIYTQILTASFHWLAHEDVAFAKVNIDLLRKLEVEAFEIAGISEYPISGDNLTVIGFPGMAPDADQKQIEGTLFKFSSWEAFKWDGQNYAREDVYGFVARYKSLGYRLKGMSGGIVLNQHNHVIGLLSADGYLNEAWDQLYIAPLTSSSFDSHRN